MTLQESARSWLRSDQETALCADGQHDDCPGSCVTGWPETGRVESPCRCACHAYGLVRDLVDEVEYLEARLEGVRLERDIFHVVARREREEAAK